MVTPPQHDDFSSTVPDSIEELRPWLRDMREELRANTAATRRIENTTATLVEAIQSAQGFWRVVRWIGDAGMGIVKAIAVAGGLGAAVWLALRTWFERQIHGG